MQPTKFVFHYAAVNFVNISSPNHLNGIDKLRLFLNKYRYASIGRGLTLQLHCFFDRLSHKHNELRIKESKIIFF